MEEIRTQAREHYRLLRYVGKWAAITVPLAVAVGAACALFLWLLDQLTRLRMANMWLLYLLPLAGVGIAWLYRWVGRGVEGGNNLIMDAISAHGKDDSSVVVPGRMAPLILLATLVSHLFGASVGREGTAVQMGGALAARLGRALNLRPRDQRTLLMAGISAGFAGVFGTPITAAVFALEVLAIGTLNYEAVVPCLMAGLVANWAAHAFGVAHAVRVLPAGLFGEALPEQLLLAGKVAIAAAVFGLAAALFAAMAHGLGAQFRRRVANPLLRPVIGGALFIGFTLLVGNYNYVGIGTIPYAPGAVTIDSAFSAGGAGPFSWLLKLFATALSLGSGFKGGEVTPLFYIGAALGNQLAGLLAAPVPLMAALGFAAVFGAATNTPLAGTLLGIEVFGAEYAALFAIATFGAYLFSGHAGIYQSQQVGQPKPGRHKR